MATHQNQHVWNGENIRLLPHRHGGLKVVASVLPVRHCVVGMKCDVVFLDVFSEKHFEGKTLYFVRFMCLPVGQFKMLSKSRLSTSMFLVTVWCLKARVCPDLQQKTHADMEP